MYDRNIRCDWDADLASEEAALKYVSYLERQLALGSGKAGFILHILAGGGLVVGSPEARNYLSQSELNEVEILEQSFPLLHDEALKGDGQAMHFLAHYYQSGLPPLAKSVISMYWYWVGKCKHTDYGRHMEQF